MSTESQEQAGPTRLSTVAVLLAAGAGSRFVDVRHKLLADLDSHGNTVIERSLCNLIEAQIGQILIITGALTRDDLATIGPQPVVRATELPFDITDRVLVVVDDVLYTGRTVRAALDSIIDFGRPKVIQLAVLVDRGHREVPIRPDSVGPPVPPSHDESVEVRLAEIDEIDEVVLRRIPEADS